jgi:hypothetical protein
MKFNSIEAFVTFLRTRPAAVEEAQKTGMERAGRMLVTTAQDMIGEDMPRWDDLAPATFEEKQRLGYVGRVSAEDPLLRTGELRASIGCTIEGNKLTIGSEDPVAKYQEEGTDKIPPRPFMGPTMYSLGPEAADVIANYELGAAMALHGPLRPIQRRDGDDRQ